jgi:hypothetical protein
MVDERTAPGSRLVAYPIDRKLTSLKAMRLAFNRRTG